MTLLEAIVLGLAQGSTEFLPISSDGHLALIYKAFRMSPDLTFEVFLHLATLVAMVAYFRADLAALLRSLGPSGKGSPERRVAALIAGATVVSGAIALGIGPVVEPASSSLLWTGMGFLVTSLALVTAETLARRTRRAADLSAVGAAGTAVVALAQSAAVLPGVSRSGLTIGAGMLSGLSREQAARFSFLLGVPIIALASADQAIGVFEGHVRLPALAPSVAGFAAALLAGYLAVWWLLRLVREHSLLGFSVYTALIGTASIVVHFIA